MANHPTGQSSHFCGNSVYIVLLILSLICSSRMVNSYLVCRVSCCAPLECSLHTSHSVGISPYVTRFAQVLLQCASDDIYPEGLILHHWAKFEAPIHKSGRTDVDTLFRSESRNCLSASAASFCQSLHPSLSLSLSPSDAAAFLFCLRAMRLSKCCPDFEQRRLLMKHLAKFPLPSEMTPHNIGVRRPISCPIAPSQLYSYSVRRRHETMTTVLLFVLHDTQMGLP